MSLDSGFLFRVLIFPGFAFILFFTMFCDWVERKIEARMQNRMGPTYTGPAGVLQPFADFVKLLTKEDIVPFNVKKLHLQACSSSLFLNFCLRVCLFAD